METHTHTHDIYSANKQKVKHNERYNRGFVILVKARTERATGRGQHAGNETQ